jgi:hypothetical protein
MTREFSIQTGSLSLLQVLDSTNSWEKFQLRDWFFSICVSMDWFFYKTDGLVYSFSPETICVDTLSWRTWIFHLEKITFNTKSSFSSVLKEKEKMKQWFLLHFNILCER